MGSREPTTGQLPIRGIDQRYTPGRVERRMAAACRLRRRHGSLTATDDGLVVLALELARSIDRAAADRKPYAVAQVGGVLREVEVQLATRAGGTGTTFDAFLASLSAEGGDGPQH